MRKPRAHDVNVPFMNPLQITWGTVCFRRYSILQSIGHSTGCSIGYRVFYKIYTSGRSIPWARGSSIRYVPGIWVAFYKVFLRVFYMKFFLGI